MPGNPVAATPGVSHSKSLRSRLGFGGSGGVASKPSFFSLKPGRKSFGGAGDFRGDERPVLVIDSEPGHGRASYDNRVVLNEETERSRPLQNPFKLYSLAKDFPSQLPKSTASHSLPASPTRSARATPNSRIPKFDFQSSSIDVSRNQADPDESGLSKHLPDLSTDVSLLMNELPPDTASQSDFHESKASHSDANGPTVTLSKEKTQEAPAFGSSPIVLDNNDRSPCRGSQEPASAAHQLHATPANGHGAVPGLTNGTGENTSISFDLSSAKLSLDLIRPNFGDEWTRNVVVEGSAAPSADTSAIHDTPPRSLEESNSGPVTSTPFLNRARSQAAEAEISFNLDALDPDLVALLRPNTYNEGPPQTNRVVTPSPLEPFAPPPDPLNPDTTAKRPYAPTASPSVTWVTNRQHGQVDGAAQSPVCKDATLASSASFRPPRSNTAQEPIPSVYSQSTVESHLDLHRPQTHIRLDRRASPALTPSSDVGATPSPLSATPLTPDDLEFPRKPSPMLDLKVATRRVPAGAPVQAHIPRPGSALTFSTDFRPTSRFPLQERDHELRQTSISPSPVSPGPSMYGSGSLGRERDRTRPSLDGLFPARFSPERSTGRPSSSSVGNSHNVLHTGTDSHSAYSNARERGWNTSAESRSRKRSMSLDQSLEQTSAGGGHRAMTEDGLRPGGVRSRLRALGDGDRDWAGSGSDIGYKVGSGLDVPFDGRYREREYHGSGYGDRERYVRPDWLGPRTAKAFAAAGLLEDPREPSGSRYGAFSRSASERDFRAAGTGNGRERERWIPVNGRTLSADVETDRGHYRHNLASTARSNSDREFTSSMMRAGAETPSTTSMTRPPSSGESSQSRSTPLFARTMSELTSYRGGADRLDSTVSMHHRPGSNYSPGGVGTVGDSAGSEGGRASPTTTSSLVAVQSQIQTLKEKHDTQTEALLAALADSQRTVREMKEENETLKGQVRMLEERLAETIASSRQREKEFARSMRTQSQSTERKQTMRSRRNQDYPHLQAPPASKAPTRIPPSPTKRRLSTSSSIFPTLPTSMSLLMAESPGSPPPLSLAFDSRPPSPTLVPPRSVPKLNSPERRAVDRNEPVPSLLSHPVPISHKRSTSGASVATSANFSSETGSPGSLKLKPEHELLLGDMTRLSLATGFGGDSEVES